jgi:hypothetical protein
LLFDDFVTESPKENQEIGKFFSRGRHKNISCMYITQNFTGVPLIVRRNCNYFFLFGDIDDSDLSFLAHKVATDLKPDKFKHIYHEATDDKYSFLMIDKETELEPLQYRKKFDTVCLRR